MSEGGNNPVFFPQIRGDGFDFGWRLDDKKNGHSESDPKVLPYDSSEVLTLQSNIRSDKWGSFFSSRNKEKS